MIRENVPERVLRCCFGAFELADGGFGPPRGRQLCETFPSGIMCSAAYEAQTGG